MIGKLGSLSIGPLPANTLGMGPKVARTFCGEFIVTLQLLGPHAPPQTPKNQPLAGVAVNVTVVPAAKSALQVEPQLIPEGELVTLPPELPTSESDKV